MKKLVSRSLAIVVAMFATGVTEVAAQEHGSGADTGCGDLFGDLIHVRRDPATGVPILLKRWVAGERDVYGWAYCPIALDATGAELRYLPDSCDADPASGTAVAVDYFGRLSAGRTKQRNVRMHFDEVVDKIKHSEAVWRDASGRLALGLGCTSVGPEAATCGTWTLVDSPLENLALYHHLMKYGHFQTDPLEVDTWAHGDPTLPIQYHPALAAADYPKFVGEARELLPAGAAEAATACFTIEPFPCAVPQPLTSWDHVVASSFLGTAADKTGHATVDLIHYMNRILKIPVSTPDFPAVPVRLLYPKYRDCGDDPAAQLEPASSCPVLDADASFPAPANEAFLNLAALRYARASHFDHLVEAMRPVGTLELPSLRLRLLAVATLLKEPVADVWVVDNSVSLLEWLEVRNGTTGAIGVGTDGFVKATNDALRVIEFVHEYAVPENLGWDFRAP